MTTLFFIKKKLHKHNNKTLFQDPTRPKYEWMMDHTENTSGTSLQYTPYTTTVPKIEAWDPTKLSVKK